MLPPRKRARWPTELDERRSLGACRQGSLRQCDRNQVISMNRCNMDAVVLPQTAVPIWARALSQPACVEAIAVASPGDVMKVRNAVVALAAGAMDAESVRLVSLVVYRVASSHEGAAALLAVECVRDALVAMSGHASTSSASAVRWVSLALHAVTSGRSRCVKELFSTVAVRDALVFLAHRATTPCAVEAVSLALSDLTFYVDSHKKAFSSECVRDGLLSMVQYATTPQSIERLAVAFGKCIFLSRCETFLCVRVLDALLAMCSGATTAECVWQVSDALRFIRLVRFTTHLVSRMVTKCEVRDAIVMLASRVTTSRCAGGVASTFLVMLREDWWKGPPQLFGTLSVHDALVELASRETEPQDVAACGEAVQLFTKKAQGAVKRELVTHAMRDAVVALAPYATTGSSALSIKYALAALKSTYRAGSLAGVLDALEETARSQPYC
ncbi:Hypothetical protein, putative [Bodo saltans]|uniref:Uncharacterized protein n=1 Tax=Bodo saltans TaxID=75058 RepID=A0A0S4JCJ3_BODSA|nr:Hypothetical protein, putative [Bodo saltans]|eukprot:CUG87731.1 Hypothetical protein, putative [Bodo saltans]